jgi:hypothetical protein
MSASPDRWFALFRTYLDVFVECRRLAGRPASDPQINHTDDGYVTARWQCQNVADSNRLTRPFHGPRIESHPSLGAIGAGDRPALAKPRKPEPLIEPSTWLLFAHVGAAPSDLDSNSSSTEKGDDASLFLPVVRAGARL